MITSIFYRITKPGNRLKTAKILAALVVLTISLSGCGLFNENMESPRKSQKNLMRGEVNNLRRQNKILLSQQKKNSQEMIKLRNLIIKEQSENRRFREMMATNFDLMEQSVALSLTKTMEKSQVVQPDQLKLPENKINTNSSLQPSGSTLTNATQKLNKSTWKSPPAQDNKAEIKVLPVTRGDSNKIVTGNYPKSGSNGNNNIGQNPVIRTVATGMTNSSGMEKSTRASVEDKDLQPPDNPRRLQAHREAKPLYDKGFKHFAKKEYDLAIMVYQNFLNRFPEDIYSDNAQFWIAESYLRQNRMEEAENAYRKVLRNYEHRSSLEGYKTPEAIYRIGLTFLKRNDSRRAKYYFSNVADRFPNSSAGRKAQKELSSMIINTADNSMDNIRPDS